MHNPFVLFSNRLFGELLLKENTHFVRQTYPRGADHFRPENVFLLSHYKEADRAQIHFDTLTADPHRFLYDIAIPEHLDRLEKASRQPAGFRIYATILQEDWRPSKDMAGKMRRYIQTRLPWRPSRYEGVNSTLSVEFGILFITLKCNKDEVRVPLSDIEKS